jgi:outer membrane protein assembly factor BamB
MIINKNTLQISGIFILILTVLGTKAFCQSYPVIDLDTVDATKLKEEKAELSIPGDVKRVNKILQIKETFKVPGPIDYYDLEDPIISDGIIYLNTGDTLRSYNLETGEETALPDTTYPGRYAIEEFYKKKPVQGILGTSYDKIPHIASIDRLTGDTLWTGQEDIYYPTYEAREISIVQYKEKGEFIINPKTGEKLFKLAGLKFSISEIKVENDILYLLTGNLDEYRITAINLEKGKVIWRVKGDFYDFFIDDTRIYTNNRFALDKKTGEVIWHIPSKTDIEGVVGGCLIAYIPGGPDDDSYLYLYDKQTRKPVGYLFHNNKFCNNCFGYSNCDPYFDFAGEGEGNKTAARIKCEDGLYLCTFEIAGEE